MFRLWFTITLSTIILIPLFPLKSIQARQDDNLLIPFEPVTGNLDDDNMRDEWVFEGEAGQMISLVVTHTVGNLDPVLALYDPSGEQLAINDNAAYDEQDARLEGLQLTETGKYRVEVYREGLEYGNSIGQYRLILFRGLSIPVVAEPEPEILSLEGGIREASYTVTELQAMDFYTVFDVTMPPGERQYSVEWRFHETNATDPAWAFQLESDGRWTIGLSDSLGSFSESESGRNPDDIVPAPGNTAQIRFTKSANTLCMNSYNQQVVCYTPTGDTPTEPGSMRIVLRGSTRQNAGQELPLTIENFYVSSPYYDAPPSEAGAIGPTPPGERLYNYDGTPLEIIAELRQLGYIPEQGGGIQAQFTDGFILNDEIGFNAYPLASMQQFQNFVIGYEATVVQGNPNTACGILFRQRDAANFATAVFTPEGQLYFLQYQRGESPGGIARTEPAVIRGSNIINRFIVVADFQDGWLFVNGRLIGQIELEPVPGTLAVNMVITEEVTSFCLLNSGWVWRLD